MHQPSQAPEDGTSTDTSQFGRGPRCARGHPRHGWADRSSGLPVRWVAGGTDDLAERPVEPIGEGGPTVGDAADWSGVAAKADPSVADYQLSSSQSGRLGVAEQMGHQLTCRSAGDLLPSLDARREGRDAPFRGTGGNARMLGRGLGATAASGGGGVGEGHQLDRTVSAGRVVGGCPGPYGISVDVHGDPAVLGEYPLPTIRRGGRRLTTGRSNDDSVDRTGSVDDGVQRVGSLAEAVSELSQVTLDGPGLKRGSNRRGQTWAVGHDDTGPHLRRCDLGRPWLVEDRPEPGIAAAGARLLDLGFGKGGGDDRSEERRVGKECRSR